MKRPSDITPISDSAATPEVTLANLNNIRDEIESIVYIVQKKGGGQIVGWSSMDLDELLSNAAWLKISVDRSIAKVQMTLELGREGQEDI